MRTPTRRTAILWKQPHQPLKPDVNPNTPHAIRALHWKKDSAECCVNEADYEDPKLTGAWCERVGKGLPLQFQRAARSRPGPQKLEGI